MAKKQTKKETKKLLTHLNEDNVIEANIFEYCRELMLIYGANVNIARSIPNGLDGLKPVERRIFYCMYDSLKMKPGQATKKVQRVSGEVMGKFHPQMGHIILL